MAGVLGAAGRVVGKGSEKVRVAVGEAAEASRIVTTQGSKRALDAGKKVSSGTLRLAKDAIQVGGKLVKRLWRRQRSP